jgi:signal transduction histidine kinase
MLPPVPCLPGDVPQVVLNILTNSVHAIEARQWSGNTGETGRISVSTRWAADCAEIKIADNGVGIPAEMRSRVFDPFFTTKPVGKGTGQGLTVAYSIVVERHGGEIHFDSTVGQGTTFTVRLPLASDHLVNERRFHEATTALCG